MTFRVLQPAGSTGIKQSTCRFVIVGTALKANMQ